MFTAYKYSFSLRHYNFPTVSHDAKYTHSVDVQVLCDEPDESPPEFYFSSHHLDELTEPAQVWNRGRQLLGLYKAAQILAENARTQAFLQLDMQLVMLYENETNRSLPYRVETAPVPIFSATEMANPRDPRHLAYAQSDTIGAVLYAARTEHEVLTLLRQLANGLSYQNLYAIGDTLKTFASQQQGFKKLLEANGHTEADYRAFTGVANNFGLLGTEARHGDLGYGIPQKQMTLPEAQYMITSLCRQYLADMYGLRFPTLNEPRPASDWNAAALF